MTRGLLRIDPENFDNFATEVMNGYNRKLIFSGYPWEERARIIEGGMTSYLDKKEKGPLYKKARDTLAVRNLRKLTGKTSWYKGWGQKHHPPKQEN